MVGSALVKQLSAQNYTNITTRTHAELDLTDQQATNAFFKQERIHTVFLAAAKAGGIYANNTYRADFIYQNLMIQSNVIHAAYKAGIERLLFLGSSCIYPRQCPQPMKEEHLLSDYLEPTNQPYAIAKIAGIIQCDAYNRQYGTKYRAVMPTNLYGPHDNFDILNGHVLPALIRKFHLTKLAAENNTAAIEKDIAHFGPLPEDIRQAIEKETPTVNLWGTGAPKREFLHADDMADACIFVMQMSDDQYSNATTDVTHINVGCGSDITIRQLAEQIKTVVGFTGNITWDTTKPDGPKQKLLDTTRLSTAGWKPKIDLTTGINQTYNWYKNQTK